MPPYSARARACRGGRASVPGFHRRGNRVLLPSRESFDATPKARRRFCLVVPDRLKKFEDEIGAMSAVTIAADLRDGHIADHRVSVGFERCPPLLGVFRIQLRRFVRFDELLGTLPAWS